MKIFFLFNAKGFHDLTSPLKLPAGIADVCRHNGLVGCSSSVAQQACASLASATKSTAPASKQLACELHKNTFEKQVFCFDKCILARNLLVIINTAAKVARSTSK
jgi:hypothetical protein